MTETANDTPPGKRYLIVGDPISQARSPEIYNARFRADGIDATLQPLRIEPRDFELTMRGFKSDPTIDGLLITLPFKETAAGLIDELGPSGKRVGAINAIRKTADGRWIGDMFDGRGLTKAMVSANMAPSAQRVLLLGAGGAGRAIADALADAGASAIKIYDSDMRRAIRLAQEVHVHHPHCDARVADCTLNGIDVLINATPVGMAQADGLPVELDHFQSQLKVIDIIPYPEMTPLLIRAANANCAILKGRSMIEHQVDLILNFFGFF